jgi:hypothetical protein
MESLQADLDGEFKAGDHVLADLNLREDKGLVF